MVNGNGVNRNSYKNIIKSAFFGGSNAKFGQSEFASLKHRDAYVMVAVKGNVFVIWLTCGKFGPMYVVNHASGIAVVTSNDGPYVR